MEKNKKLFLKEQTETHDIYRIFGIKFAFLRRRFRAESEASKIIQDTLDLSKLQKSKKIIIFLVPANAKLNGGVMSIFSLCKTTREICPNAFCTLSTYPNGKTYVINDKFYNNEKVLRFDQIVNNAKKVQELILHIPECYAKDFYKNLRRNDIRFLQSVQNLHINILNQNIKLMPEPEDLQNLYKLTDNITQTTAHNRYTTQEVCDKWQIPTHLFSVKFDLSQYRAYPFEEKEKIIVLSPDSNENKEKIVKKLEKEFFDWEIITVQDMSFNEYMDLISRAYFTITFGEGFDGYFTQPPRVNSIGISVYNNQFFPDDSWLELPNVFTTYDDMANNIIDTMKQLYGNKEEYCKISTLNNQKRRELYKYEQYKDNLKRFYEKKYDFLPQTGEYK